MSDPGGQIEPDNRSAPNDRSDLSDRSERWLTFVLRLALVVIAAFGLYRGETGVVVNGVVALGVTLVPALLRRELDVSFPTEYVLWITVAVFLHAVGILGPYDNIPWYDSVTHALSAAIVAGVGYVTVKTVEANSEWTELPPVLEFAFIVVFVLAFGVFWEILEFSATLLARTLGGKSVLIQYGLDDTITDLVFNAIGGIVVGGWDAVQPDEAAEDASEQVGD